MFIPRAQYWKKKFSHLEKKADSIPRCDVIQRSYPWLSFRLEHAPCVRRDKVVAYREKVNSGTWRPDAGKIADRILDEHLLGCLPPNPDMSRRFMAKEL